jgi:hypothetical protein
MLPLTVESEIMSIYILRAPYQVYLIEVCDTHRSSSRSIPSMFTNEGKTCTDCILCNHCDAGLKPHIRHQGMVQGLGSYGQAQAP